MDDDSCENQKMKYGVILRTFSVQNGTFSLALQNLYIRAVICSVEVTEVTNPIFTAILRL